jgi:hypothetical protein
LLVQIFLCFVKGCNYLPMIALGLVGGILVERLSAECHFGYIGLGFHEQKAASSTDCGKANPMSD